MMPNTIGKTTLHEETSDAGGEMARTIRETEASRKSVRDAAEAGREASRGEGGIGGTGGGAGNPAAATRQKARQRNVPARPLRGSSARPLMPASRWPSEPPKSSTRC